MYSLYIKFQEKIFTGKRIIQLWNFGNFGIPEIIPKILVTLRFSKISLHELKGNCKCFKMRYWPHFYVDPTHSNTYFSKVGIWRVLLQGTVHSCLFEIEPGPCYEVNLRVFAIAYHSLKMQLRSWSLLSKKIKTGGFQKCKVHCCNFKDFKVTSLQSLATLGFEPTPPAWVTNAD